MIFILAVYVVFTAVAVFAPLRWAIVAYLLLACVDFQSNRDSIGVLNAVRGFAIPLYLLWRLRGQAGHRAILLAPVAWGLLIVYAGIATFWAYFPTAALKLVGEMTGSLLIGFVFARAAKGGLLISTTVIPVAIGSISLALVQMFLLHDFTTEGNRFTAFTPAQAFAAYIAALYCMALCAPFLKTYTRILLCSAFALSLVFNGSRIWFTGVVLASLTAFIISNVRVWRKIVTVGVVVLTGCLLIIFQSQMAAMIRDVAPSNRIVAAALAAYEGDTQSGDLGTLRFRRVIDDAATDQLKKSNFTDLIFGRGTSNGSLVTGSLFRSYSRFPDPNRMLHDEWLRVIYEWGLVGMLLWCSFWISVLIYAVRGVRKDSLGYAKPLLIYLPAILVALAGENIIAGAGTATTVGFLMLLGYATLAYRIATKKIELNPMPVSRVNEPEFLGSPAR